MARELFGFSLLLVSALIPQDALASLPKAHVPDAQRMRRQIEAQSGRDFEDLLDQWQKSPATFRVQQFRALESLALDHSQLERTRYIALMGAARVAPETKTLKKLLEKTKKESSWLLRSATLHLMTDRSEIPLFSAEAESYALASLKDPALLVRSQAVDSIQKLNSPRAAAALVAAALDPSNYSGGKAIWVPEKAIHALTELKATHEIWLLSPLLSHQSDPKLQTQVLGALASLHPHEAMGIQKILGPKATPSKWAKAWLELANNKNYSKL